MPVSAGTDDIFPLSFAQRRLWFLDQLEGQGAAYHVRLPVRLRGELNAQALQQAVDAIVVRHESLRTAIEIRQGEPVQVIRKHVSVPVQLIDMTGENEDSLRARSAELAGQPFDLHQPPLLRVYLLRERADSHQLLVVTHHIISDAWSSGVLFRDLMVCYEAFLQGCNPQLPELTVQYADYAVWQRDWLAGAELDRQLDYWRETLAGAPALLPLPTDRPRPAMQSYRGSRWAHFLSPSLTQSLKTLAQQESATLFMVLLAAFQALLARYSGQPDIVVGTPVAGRRRSELEELIGFFANTLVLRAQCDSELSFRKLLAQVRARSLAAFSHQELPFERLVEALQPERQLSHTPVFQVMFVLQNVPWQAQGLTALDVEPGVIAPVDAAKFDLTLSMAEGDDGLWANFEYNTDLFDDKTIERIAESFECLLDALVRQPECSVGSLPLQADAAMRAQQAAWNDTTVDYPRELTLAQFIQGGIDLAPDTVAVSGAGVSWTYAELDTRAMKIAEALRELGVARNTPVAVCVDRSPALLAAVVGVLKSGGAYLPLDPGYPRERLDFMLGDSGTGVLLTDTPDLFPGFAGSLLRLDRDARLVQATRSKETPRDLDVSGHLAYIIYTSGSTGHPKGVLVPQRAVVNFLASMARVPGLSRHDRLLAVTTLSFDIAALELLLPLSVGAEVVIASAATAADAHALARLIATSNATVMQATPSTWRALLDAGWSGANGLRMLCGGEMLDASLARSLAAAGDELWNLYGPTETTIWSTCTRVEAGAAVTIGQPIANTRVYIVDDELRPLPVGIPGELLIAGDGLSLGYHDRSVLTAQKFVILPGSEERVYRTGDRARWRRDGQLELLGRTDGQVKLRGFRIELGEIEAVLSAHPTVSAAVAGLRRAPTGEARLVVWLQPAASGLAVATLRRWLAGKLPDYMVPGHWVELAALPLTPNGKVDRGALPAPAWGAAVAGGRAPRTPVEGLVCELFAAVLARSSVGIDDDFFALGGHSLLATQLVSRLRDALGVEVALRSVFETPTPAGISTKFADVSVPHETRIQQPIPVSDTAIDTAPATFMQRRLWFLDRLQPGNPIYNLAWCTELSGRLDREALQAAVDAIAARHSALRTVLEEHDGEPVQRIGQMSPSIAWLEQGDAGTLQACAEQAFDLSSGPLWRVVVQSDAEDRHELLVVVHHVVADGWSMGVLFRDLATAYAAARAGTAPVWPALSLQYADYARWQRAELAGGQLDRELAYWREQLAGAPTVLALPTDRPRPAVQSWSGARLSRHLERSLVDACQRLARDTGGTLFMVLAAALATVLGRHAGSAEVLLGTPIAGRGRTELEQLVGFFVNTLVLRVDVASPATGRELLAQVRRTALDAYAHPDLPFEKLVEELSLPRDPARSPLFQVMFNLHNEPQQTVDWPGLKSRPVSVARQTAKFDLTVACTETPAGLTTNLEYNADLYTAESIDRLGADFESLLHYLSSSADWSLSGWPGEAWPAALAVAPLPGGDVWSAFSQVASRHRKALAVSDGQVRWSYGALAEYANRVAQSLVAAGLEPGERVGLLAGHTAGAVAGLLGIVQAGGAYVVLDPQDPVARQRRVLDHVGSVRVVSEASHAPVAGRLGRSVVTIDTRADGRQTSPVGARAGAQSLAYVLMTSGTTGTPKGVMQSHGGLLAQVSRYAASLELVATDRLSGLAGLGYDAAVQDVFGALLTGASLHLQDLGDGRAAAAQVEALGSAAVTVVHATPTVYRYLFGGELDCRHELATVRAVVLGGEVARRSDFELFRSRFAATAMLVNGYGLTECTVGLQWRADGRTVVRGEGLPLGRPVGELGVRLVDAEGRVSWRGEIELAGAGLAPGYWADAAQTAARFVADPQAPGGRWYRTGDWGWWRPDGTLGYLGRVDGQVKLRGRRLELGEVETALAACAGVQAAAVAVRASAAGDDQLVGYVCGAGELDSEGLAAELRQVLPAALVPTAWVALAALPRTASGKLDREALPAPVRRAAAVGEPRSALEQRLAGLWAELLGLEQVAVHEDFFALGGHSLLATRLIARIRDQLNREISLLALFENPTVSGLADVLEATPEPGTLAESPAIAALARIHKN